MASFLSHSPTLMLLGFGLILIIEGLVYALLPERMKALMGRVINLPDETLRTGGLIAAGSGSVMLWFVWN